MSSGRRVSNEDSHTIRDGCDLAQRAGDQVVPNAPDRRRVACHPGHRGAGVRPRRLLGAPRRRPGLDYLGAFAANLIVMLAVTPDRRRWLLENPLDVLIVVLTPPFLPVTLKIARVPPVV